MEVLKLSSISEEVEQFPNPSQCCGLFQISDQSTLWYKLKLESYPIILVDINSTVKQHFDNICVSFTASQWEGTFSPFPQNLRICTLKKNKLTTLFFNVRIYTDLNFKTFKHVAVLKNWRRQIELSSK